MKNVRIAYVIMPVGSDPLYDLRRAAIQRGLVAARVNSCFPNYSLDKPDFRLSDLKSELGKADVILVDLSRERPSCYYELGIAEAMDKKILSMAEMGTRIHQFSGRNEVNFYDNFSDIEKIIAINLLELAY